MKHRGMEWHVLIAAGASAVLASCAPGPDRTICRYLPVTLGVAMPDPADPIATKAAAERCLWLRAYQYHRGPDDALTVAAAVRAACRLQVERAQTARVRSTPDGVAIEDLRASKAAFDDEALVNVIEARAGRCRAPA